MKTIAPGTTLLLIRHGETQWNLDQRVQGHTDIALTERGVAQAERLAEWLADERLDAIFSSDLQRARRTAEILARGKVEVVTDARLREVQFGAFEGLTVAEIEAGYPEAYHAWREDSVRNRPPGGETLEALRDRSLAALYDYLPQYPGQTVAVVAHGGTVRGCVCGLLDLPIEATPRFRVDNTSVSRFAFTERGPVLTAFNDTAHLRDRPAVGIR
jgi:broad specificity phosphatase PhoE